MWCPFSDSRRKICDPFVTQYSRTTVEAKRGTVPGPTGAGRVSEYNYHSPGRPRAGGPYTVRALGSSWGLTGEELHTTVCNRRVSGLPTSDSCQSVRGVVEGTEGRTAGEELGQPTVESSWSKWPTPPRTPKGSDVPTPRPSGVRLHVSSPV